MRKKKGASFLSLSNFPKQDVVKEDKAFRCNFELGFLIECSLVSCYVWFPRFLSCKPLSMYIIDNNL